MTDIQKENKSGGKVPNLRFPGFFYKWEITELTGLGEFLGGGTPSSSNDDFWKGNVPWISSSDLSENNIHSVNVSRFITEEAINNSATKLCSAPVILIVSRVGVGKVAYSGKSLCTSQDFLNIINFKCNGIFLSYLLSTEMKKAASAVQGTSIKGISSVEIKSKKLYIPKISEQNKIASFLSLIDERITTQSKIIEGLKKLKVATAKKIFSQEFRFKDDKGNDFSEWEEILLGEVMSIPEKTKAQNIDKNKLLTVKLHLKGVLKNDNTDTLSFGATNYFIRKKGQFIYGKQNLFNGAFDIIPDEFDGFLSSGDVPTLEINNSKINSSFLLYLMGRKEFYKPLEDFATGSGSKRIHEKTLLGIKIPFPSLPEQTKIVNFLSAIDSKIDMETQLLQKLEEQKKFLLQNMFV